MATLEETADWRLVDIGTDYPFGNPGRWIVYNNAKNPTAQGQGATPYAAWFDALIQAGFTKYLAHDMTLERLGVQPEPPNRPILA